jgi:VCBS repeat-containing protein
LAQSLAVNEVFEEVLEVTLSDGIGPDQTQTVVVSVIGSNDAPVVTSGPVDARGSLTEGEELIETSGKITAIDPDTNDSYTWTAVSAAIYGVFTFSDNGDWTYVLNNALADQLAAGETVTETLTVTAEDTNGGTVAEIIEVEVIGSNDRPIVAINTNFATIEGASVSGQLVATDIDSPDDGLTFELAPDGLQPANGNLTFNEKGSFQYTPDEGFVGIERFEYVVDDGNGGQSTARATIAVESDQNDPDNEGVSLRLNMIANGETAAGAVEIGITPADVASVNLAIALDRSGSINRSTWNDMIDATRDALTILARQFEGSDTTVDVKFITFAGDVRVSETYNLQSPELFDVFESNVFDSPRGLTAWELAFQEAGEFFFSEPSSEANFLLFVTDGVPTNPTLYLAPLGELKDPNDDYNITISAFGIGNFEEGSLDAVDENATFLVSADQLADAFRTTPIFNPELLNLTIEIEADDGPSIIIPDEDISFALVSEGTNFELPLASIENIVELLGASNRISITAQFDLNNDPSTAEIQLFKSEIIGKAESAQTINGLAGADLLFGSDEGDNITGAAGNDILFGYGGNDTLDAGTGNDTVRAGDGDDHLIVSDALTAGDDLDGGAGRDVLAIKAVGDINDMLADLDLSGIEAIDMSNGQLDTLILTYEDVFNLSDTGDRVLNELLGEDLTESITIYGDGNDELLLDGQGIYQISQKVSDAGGLDVWEFSGADGNVLATLGVASDIEVATANVPVA